MRQSGINENILVEREDHRNRQIKEEGKHKHFPLGRFSMYLVSESTTGHKLLDEIERFVTVGHKIMHNNEILVDVHPRTGFCLSLETLFHAPEEIRAIGVGISAESLDRNSTFQSGVICLINCS